MRFVLFAVVAGLLVGCNSSQPTSSTSSTSSVEKTKYQLAEEPRGAKGVIQLKEAAADGDDIVVEGRIGGDPNPWVSGQAAFLVVDTSLKPCPAEEGCETPWDYCCDVDLLRGAKAMVKVIDDNGKIVAADARELLGLKELQTVVVRGKAKRDESGNLTILATGVFVRS